MGHGSQLLTHDPRDPFIFADPSNPWPTDRLSALLYGKLRTIAPTTAGKTASHQVAAV